MRLILLYFLIIQFAFGGLVAEYRMDSCNVANTGRLIDFSGNGNDATLQLVTTESNETLGGIMCYAGDFTHVATSDKIDTDDDYVALPSTLLDGKKDFTITMWIKTTNTTGTLISAVNDDTTTNELWLYMRRGTRIWLYFQDRRRRLDFGKNIADGAWHHIAITRSVGVWGSSIALYLDGVEVDSAFLIFNYSALYVRGLVLGQDQDTILGRFQASQEFNGYMDEVKFFDEALASSAIRQIYQNERDRRNWDSTLRACCCNDWIPESMFTPLQMQGGWVHLKNTIDDPTWTHVDFAKPFATKPVIFMVTDINGPNPASVRIKNVTKFGFDVTIAEPQGMDGPHVDQNVSFIAVNPGLHKLDGHIIEVGTIGTKKVQGNYANGDIGWQKVDTVARFCQPAILANIQTLNNEQNPIPQKPSKPWMTAVIKVDESKNIYMALDRSETSNAKVEDPETIGYMISNADFVGSFRDRNKNTIKFEIRYKDRYFEGWDNSCKTIDFINTFSKKPVAVGWKNSRYGDNGGWFRICEFTNEKIGFVVDEDTAHDSERWHIPEDGAIYAFSDVFVIDEIEEENKNFRFDAIDTFRDINDRNISTKIVNKDFSLTIISMDSNASNYQEFNGTVCVQITESDHNDTNFTGWAKLQFSDQNSSSWQNIVVNRAVKSAKVKIAWKEDVNESCPLGNEDNRTLSSDSFAIRPLRFTLQLPTIAYAKDDFNISASAIDQNGDPAKDYNETRGVSFTIDANETKHGCQNGSLQIEQFHFQDGVAQNIDANYSEIGDINITLYEINGSEFAQVDADDTNDSMRLIEPASQILHVKPYKIKIEEVRANASTGKDWLYVIKDDNISEMNLTVGAKVQALDKDNGLLEDFNATCYGEDLHVRFWYDEDITTNAHPISVKYVGTTSDDIALLSDCNKSIRFPKSVFHAGEGYKEYAFDINSTFYQPLSPIQLRLDKATITETTLSKVVENRENIDRNITFYYASLRAKDLYTSKQDDTTAANILVYDKAGSIYTQNWKEFIIDWYLMQDDDVSQVTLSRTTEGFDYDSVQISDMTATFSPETNGTTTISISNPSKHPNAFLHLDIASWLWYSANKRATFAKDQSCAHHPCIHYRYFDEDGSSVTSGEVRGVHFDQNISKHRRGVKVFR